MTSLTSHKQAIGNNAILTTADKPAFRWRTLWAGLLAKAAACIRKLNIWHARHNQRRALAQLSSYELKDIGLTRSDAMEEVYKPFWKP